MMIKVCSLSLFSLLALASPLMAEVLQAALPVVPAFLVAHAEAQFYHDKPNLKAEFYIYLQSASYCRPCVAMMPRFAAEYLKMKADGRVELIYLSDDSTIEASVKFLTDSKATFPAFKGINPPGKPVAYTIPNVAIVDANGVLIAAGASSVLFDWEKYVLGTQKAPHQR